MASLTKLPWKVTSGACGKRSTTSTAVPITAAWVSW